MRYNFVIIVKPKFPINIVPLDEDTKERICAKLAKIIERIKGVASATVDWEGTIGEQNE